MKIQSITSTLYKEVSYWATGIDSTTLWNCTKEMKTILPKDIPSTGVFMIVVQSKV